MFGSKEPPNTPCRRIRGFAPRCVFLRSRSFTDGWFGLAVWSRDKGGNHSRADVPPRVWLLHRPLGESCRCQSGQQPQSKWKANRGLLNQSDKWKVLLVALRAVARYGSAAEFAKIIDAVTEAEARRAFKTIGSLLAVHDQVFGQFPCLPHFQSTKILRFRRLSMRPVAWEGGDCRSPLVRS